MKKKIDFVTVVYFVASSFACLLPMAVGGMLWNVIPVETIRQTVSEGATRTTGWTREAIVIGLPVFFLIIHLYNCILRPYKPFSKAIHYWTTPILCSLCFLVLLALSLIW